CKAAVFFLGLETTRNLVLTYTLRELFKTDSALLRQRMTDLWQHSALVASVSYLLAGTTPSMERERGMLAGLLHDIGILPIIHYAGRYPELSGDPEHLERTIDGLRGQIGAMLLRHWRFGDEMVQVALECEQWQRDPDRTADLTDLVLVAQLIAGDPDRDDLPEPTAVPAARKLARGRLDPELCAELREEARREVAETLGLFA
ncbi:MAG TPA: HDOD domain-containing protein, partial [Gammaproteobacteria bacterium]|nr:HDOD domain-containing protein [Gammaproteobacteria bacterium]